MLLKSLFGFAGARRVLGCCPGAGGAPGPPAAASSCGLPWSVLAGAFVESDFGANLGPSSAGAYGCGQFMPGTWPSYSDGVPWRTSNPAQLALPPSERFDSSNFRYALPLWHATSQIL